MTRTMRHGLIWGFACCAASAWPCDTTVRGKAFEEVRDVHRLCVIADGPAAQSLASDSQLQQWRSGSGQWFNAELLHLDARDEKIEWLEYGMPSAPADLPVVVLAGLDRASRRRFVIAHWQPGPTPEELDRLTGSPVREAIQREVGKRWAVLLHSPAADGRTSRASDILDATVRAWAEQHPPGVSLVRLDRADPRERLLVSFIGLQPSGPDWVGVVFGRGKLMVPPLEGDGISSESLQMLLSRLTEICSCLQPPSMMGVDIPMTWEPELEKSVVSLVAPGAPTAIGMTMPEPEIRSGNRSLLTIALSALGLSVLMAAGVTMAIVRRESRRNRS